MIQLATVILLLCVPVGFAVKIRNQCSHSPVDWYQGVREGNESVHMPQDLVVSETRNMAASDSCNLNQNNQIQGVILLDLYGEPHLLTVTEKNLLASLIVETLKETTTSCENGLFRTINSFQLVPATFQNLGTRPFSLEFNIIMTCRGCSTQATLLEYLDSNGKPQDTCPCGGPSLVKFQILFQEKFDDVLNSRKLPNIEALNVATEIIEASKCPAFSTFTTSDVIVEFYGCPLNLQQSDVNTLASRFKDTYNSINGLTSQLCDPFFREITTITATLPTDYVVTNFNDDGGSSQQNFECPDYFELLFQVDARCRGCDIKTITLFDEEEDVNFYNDDTFSDDTTSGDDTSGDDTSGDDTSGDDNIDDDNNDRRRSLTKSMFSNIFRHTTYDDSVVVASKISHGGTQEKRQVDPNRRQAAQSDCRCPIDSRFRAITEEEMINAFNATLRLFNDNLSDQSVEDVIEIEDVQCSADVNNFDTVINIEFLTDSDDGIVSDQIAMTLKENLVRSYNTLSDRFCDPFFRFLDSADILSQSIEPVDRGRQLQSKPVSKFAFKFNIRVGTKGLCRGCPSTISALVKNDAVKRKLSPVEKRRERQRDNKYRRLQSGSGCFCGVANVANTAPTEREFKVQYNADIADLSAKLGITFKVSMVDEEVSANADVVESRVECTVAQDCINSAKGTLCVNNACLNEGNPRITLTWVGDDDLDLSVYTPGGVLIAYDADFDPETGGSFDTLYSQAASAPHVESIFFPMSGGPSGYYSIDVDLWDQVGSPDAWTLEVFTASGKSVPVFVQESTGSQYDILFYFGDDRTDPNSGFCSVADGQTECCVDDDCTPTGKFAKRCVNRQCITEGVRTFTLSWTGNDEYALTVLTPDLDEIDYETRYDSYSGGTFEADKNVYSGNNIYHTESVYFPAKNPFGEYIYYVDMITQNGLEDAWRVEVSEMNKKVSTKNDFGSSQAFSYVAVECTKNADCGSKQICISNHCIVDGTPRFTLTWTGDDDLDIFVIPPKGNRIDWDNKKDSTSGGVLQDDPDELGTQHVESIHFGNKTLALSGNYRVGVETYKQGGENADKWMLTINVNGKQVRSWNQTGDRTFDWSYSPAPIYCFSAETTVVTKDRGTILMKDLQLGDRVATSANLFEPVYSFGHRAASLGAMFIKVMPSMLEISSNHMLFIEGGRAVPASLLKVGDRLLNGEIITSIEQVERMGVYAPFTLSGSLLVNNVTVSSYVAFQESAFLKIGSVETPLTYQWLAHAFQTPHRLWCSIAKCTEESYSNGGVSIWVYGPLQFTNWWFRQNTFLMFLVLVPVFMLLIALSCLSLVITHPILFAVGTLGWWWLLKKPQHSKFLK